MSDFGGFEYGDLVWAKMKGYCAWPGRIVEPSDALMKIRKVEKSHCVYFFGSQNYGWIEDVQIKPFEEFKGEMLPLGKPKAQFEKALGEIEAYIANPDSSSVIITPARRKTIPAIRKSNAGDFENSRSEEDINNRSSTEGSFNIAEATPPAAVKVQVNKRSTQKKTPKPILIKKSQSPAFEETEQSPAKRSRLASPASNQSAIVYNNNNDLPDDSKFADYASPTPRSRIARALIDRPQILTKKPELTDLDVTSISDTLKSKNIKASTSKFGFIGLGIMGSGIVKNLINSGHQVGVYNRTQDKTKKFAAAGAKVFLTPSDVIEYADITFSCVSDPEATKNILQGSYGVDHVSMEMARNKGFVEMSTVDDESSQDTQSFLKGKGMRYLEAQIQGTKAQAEEGKLIILAAGDRELFNECQTCFEAMGSNSFFLGEAGNASKMNLVLQSFAGISIAALADSMALADKAGLPKERFLQVLDMTSMRSDLFTEKGSAMFHGRFDQVSLPLMHIQKDLKLAIKMADGLNHPMPLAAIANESYKHARRLGYAEYDASAIYFRARH